MSQDKTEQKPLLNEKPTSRPLNNWQVAARLITDTFVTLGGIGGIVAVFSRLNHGETMGEYVFGLLASLVCEIGGPVSLFFDTVEPRKLHYTFGSIPAFFMQYCRAQEEAAPQSNIVPNA